MIGSGKSGEPRGTIFSGSFTGHIEWVLVSHTGSDYEFRLVGLLLGTLYDGRSVSGATTQSMYLNQNQWNHDQRGSIRRGGAFVGGDIRTPESGTLGSFATGLIVLAGTILPKFVFSRRARSRLDH